MEVEGEVIGEIGHGLLLLLGVEQEDGQEDLEWLVGKMLGMRIFADSAGKMNLSLRDVKGEVLVVSQFTLFASTKKGNRPSFMRSGDPQKAEALYEDFKKALEGDIPGRVECGEFGADMQVSLINDGPVTILLDSKNRE